MICKVGEDGFDVDEFKARIYNETDKKLHIIDVYTDWCGACMSVVPTFKNLQVNVDYFEDRCTITQVDKNVLQKMGGFADFETRFPQTSKPRFLFFKAGQEIN